MRSPTGCRYELDTSVSLSLAPVMVAEYDLRHGYSAHVVAETEESNETEALVAAVKLSRLRKVVFRNAHLEAFKNCNVSFDCEFVQSYLVSDGYTSRNLVLKLLTQPLGVCCVIALWDTFCPLGRYQTVVVLDSIGASTISSVTCLEI